MSKCNSAKNLEGTVEAVNYNKFLTNLFFKKKFDGSCSL